jgi:hypothetical protein
MALHTRHYMLPLYPWPSSDRILVLQEVCTTMAVILHYVLLVDFCLMMAMGIEVAYSVLYVMPSKSRKGWLLPAAWSEYYI